MNQLTTTEQTELEQYESKIEGSILMASQSLKAIHDKKLWREQYDSFEDYCEKRWKFSRQRGYQLLDFAEINEDLNQKCQPWLTSERQARELAKAPKGKRISILKKVADLGKVTAQAIKHAINDPGANEGDSVETLELDKTGYPIPKEIQSEWNRANETGKDLLKRSSELKCMLEKVNESDDPIYREVTNSTLTYAINLFNFLKQIVPYAVCTSCQGKKPDNCSLCKQRGFISQYLYQNAVPIEVKEIRKKTVEAMK